MDDFWDQWWNWFFALSIVLSLLMIFSSTFTLLSEHRRQQNILATGERRKHEAVGSSQYVPAVRLIYGVLLLLLAIGVRLVLYHSAWAFLLVAATTLLTALFIFANRGTEARRSIQAQVARRRFWLWHPSFYQRIARGLLLLGSSTTALLAGLLALKAVPFSLIDELVWLPDSLLLIGGLAWLIGRLIQRRQTQ